MDLKTFIMDYLITRRFEKRFTGGCRKIVNEGTTISCIPLLIHAELYHENGNKEKVAFYYLSGYLSQSTRSIVVPPTVTTIKIFDYSGTQKNLNVVNWL